MRSPVIYRHRRDAAMIGTATAIIMLFASCAFAGLDDPAYKEGFGKDATGGAGQPECVVSSSKSTGLGTLDACFSESSSTISNRTIVFSVSTATLPWVRNINSNVTVDGCANGMNGVTLDFSDKTLKQGFGVRDPASNVIFRCLNFRGSGAPNSYGAAANLIYVTGGTVGPHSYASNVLIDRCTFYQASDKAVDLTSYVQNITVQRSLFYGSAVTMLIKYDTRKNISVHHNVFAHNGERHPQAKGDMQLLDFVNNVVYVNDVRNFADGTSTAPYGSRLYSCGAGCDSPGDVVANLINNAYIGAGTQMELLTGPGAGSNANAYIHGNLCVPSSNCQASPRATPNVVPAAYALTTLEPGQLASQMLPFVGAPNRTPLDQQRLDEVASALKNSATSTRPPAPSGLTIR